MQSKYSMWIAVGGAAVAASGNVAVAGGSPSFSDQTAAAGLSAATTQGVATPGPEMGAGGAVGDFNNDGWQDLFWIGAGAKPDMLFINNGDGTFTDRASEWGVDATHLGIGAAVGDFDGDGWLDIYVTSHGTGGAPAPGQNRLYRNNGGAGFIDVAAAADVDFTATTAADGFGAAWGDCDRDGDLDLAVSGWKDAADGSVVFSNDGDGTFTNISATHFDYDLGEIRGFSPILVDVDGDLCPELLWAADFMTSRYLVNDGTGQFIDQTASSGTGLDGNGMGQTIGDFNNDGVLDWYVTSIYTVDPDNVSSFVPGTGNMLYIGQGNHVYSEVSAAAGVKDGGWGWGTTAVDLDHDGDQDIVETNGWENGFWNGEFAGEQAYVFMNNGDLTFTESAISSGLVHTGLGRGLVNFDYDNDGDQDIAIFTHEGPLQLFRNDLTGPNTNWLRLFLDTSNNSTLAPNGIGAKVVASVGGQAYTRWVHAGSNYLSQSELTAHFGLAGASTVDELVVTWSNGQQTVLNDVPVNQTMTIASPKLGDVNADGGVDGADLGLLLQSWGAAAEGPVVSDLNRDGAVDGADLGLLLQNWG